jgi:hypothetical protein
MGGADLGSVVRGRLEPIEEYERVFVSRWMCISGFSAFAS